MNRRLHAAFAAAIAVPFANAAPQAAAPSAPPAAPAAPAAQPPAAPASPATPPAPRRFDSADTYLDALERATTGLRDFQARVTLDRVDAVTEESERRQGRLLFVDDGEGNRRFAVVFDLYMDPSGRADTSLRHYVYRDGWLVEFDHSRKQMVSRQLVPPGKAFDPLRLGEGPLPLPVGQRKAEVLARFEVSLVGPPTTPLLKGVGDAQGLRLLPRPGVLDDDTVDATIWYDPVTLLPRAVSQRKRSGERVEVLVSQPAMNAGLDETQRSFLEVTEPGPEWSRDIRPWKQEGPPVSATPAEEKPAPGAVPAAPRTPGAPGTPGTPGASGAPGAPGAAFAPLCGP